MIALKVVWFGIQNTIQSGEVNLGLVGCECTGEMFSSLLGLSAIPQMPREEGEKKQFCWLLCFCEFVAIPANGIVVVLIIVDTVVDVVIVVAIAIAWLRFVSHSIYLFCD